MHAMIDIETLGLGTDVPLFEIGVVVFDVNDKKIIHTEQMDIDLLDVILTTGFPPQDDTIKWWQAQTYDPREAEDRVGLRHALVCLHNMFHKFGVTHVWGNSPKFDMAILERHFAACELKVPWTHKMELDFRTVRWMYQHFAVADTVDGWDGAGPVVHRGVDDAIYQTQLLFSMLGGFHVQAV